MTVANEELAKGLMTVKKRPMFFAFLPKGPKSALLLSKKKVTPKQIKELKEEAGGTGRVIRGRAVPEDGGIAFETSEEQKNGDALAVLLKKAAKTKANKVIKVVAVRWVKDLDVGTESVDDIAEEIMEDESLHAGDFDPGEDDTSGDPTNEDEVAPETDERSEPDEPDEPDEPAQVNPEQTAFVARLKKLMPVLHQAIASGPSGSTVRELIGSMQQVAQSGDYVRANLLLDEAETRARQAAPPGGVWTAARNKVVADVRAVAAAIAATKDPEAQKPLIELYSIIKQLPEKLESPQTIAEVERYLRDDDIVQAAETCPPIFGTLRIREPLLKALEIAKA
jgi:hypothetical protein